MADALARAARYSLVAYVFSALVALFACMALLFSPQIACADEQDASTEKQLEAGSIDYDYMEQGGQQGKSDASQSAASGGTDFIDVKNVDGFASATAFEDIGNADTQESEEESLFTRWRKSKSTTSYAVFPYVPNPSTEQFVASIAESAREIGQKEGLYASVMIAQAILESGSGSSGLSKPPYNNLFGIKGSYKGASVVLMTSEDDGSGRKYDIAAGFRRYPSVKESLEDYAKLLKHDMGAFYAPAWKANAKTYVEACNYLQGHYATDTSYSGKLQGLIIAYDLVRYDHPAGWKRSSASQEERAAEVFAAFEAAGSLGRTGEESAAAQFSEDSGSSMAAKSGATSSSNQEPLSDPGVQFSLVSLGALALFFSKNEIALLLAAAKANLGFFL